MRATDDRYRGERRRFDLAIRLIALEARTHVITQITGFSHDRVRKIYGTYFKHENGNTVRRQRGKSPSNVAFLVRNASTQGQASTLASLFGLFGLVHIDPELNVASAMTPSGVSFGERLCRAYEAYLGLYDRPTLPFEQAWNLLSAISERGDLVLSDCLVCGSLYVQDALALDPGHCPACRRH